MGDFLGKLIEYGICHFIMRAFRCRFFLAGEGKSDKEKPRRFCRGVGKGWSGFARSGFLCRLRLSVLFAAGEVSFAPTALRTDFELLSHGC